jgi:hypothetical protein
MTGKPMNPPEFDRAMTLLLNELGLPPFEPKPQAYRLSFGIEDPLFFISKPGGWLEILTSVSGIDHGKADTIAAALLALQLQQGNGALVCIGMDRQSGKVLARTRLRLSDCHPKDLIAAIHALRAHAASARALVDGTRAQAGPAGALAKNAGIRRHFIGGALAQ